MPVFPGYDIKYKSVSWRTLAKKDLKHRVKNVIIVNINGTQIELHYMSDLFSSSRSRIMDSSSARWCESIASMICMGLLNCTINAITLQSWYEP